MGGIGGRSGGGGGIGGRGGSAGIVFQVSKAVPKRLTHSKKGRLVPKPAHSGKNRPTLETAAVCGFPSGMSRPRFSRRFPARQAASFGLDSFARGTIFWPLTRGVIASDSGIRDGATEVNGQAPWPLTCMADDSQESSRAAKIWREVLCNAFGSPSGGCTATNPAGFSPPFETRSGRWGVSPARKPARFSRHFETRTRAG